MSHVATIVLLCSLDEPGIQEMNNMILDRGQPPLACASESKWENGRCLYDTGGNKAMQQDVWVGAYRFIVYEEFIDIAKKVRWEEPENVQLLINDEDHSRFFIGFGEMPSTYQGDL